MRLITYYIPEKNHGNRVGVVTEAGVVDITSGLGYRSVKQILAEDKLAELDAFCGSEESAISLNDVVLELPIPDPTRVFCIGVNYINRNAEYKDDSAAPKYPSLFMRSAFSFAPHGQSVLLPPESVQFDYEGEIVLVIGKAGRRIKQENAHAHIAGLTIMNEGSIRDWLRHAKFNVTQGKNFDRSGGLGPWIETNLNNIDLTDMWVETRVNGERRQYDTTASMAFPFARIIEYISTFTELQPGDIIATGTPTGAGARFDPPKWLKPGDVVEVLVQGVGKLSNTVALESHAS